MSMRVMSAGKGVNYLLSTVVVGDGIRDATTALTRYYAEQGTPPGFWLGSGLSRLGAGELAVRDEVTEEQLRRLIGEGCDPVTGTPLGQGMRSFQTRGQRIQAAIDALPPDLDLEERAGRITRIEQDETRRPAVTAVAGFDHTFSVPKSVSTLWAVADGGTQALIADAHHAALADVLTVLEREVAVTRIGSAATRDGAPLQTEVRGVVAAAYDHYDSRASDPQLHTHVVIANRVQAVRDGKWRTLDSRLLHHAVVGMSELYNAVLADRLTGLLGLAWERRERGQDRNDAYELTAVPEALIAEFSARSRDINAEKDRLIAEYEAKHGRHPDRAMILRLRAEATLRTRPAKNVQSLADLTTQWRSRATRVLGEEAPTWASAVVAAAGRPVLLRADDVPEFLTAELGRAVVEEVGLRRSTWRHWNLYAEACRQTMELRFASTADREAVVAAIVAAAEQASIRLTPPTIAHTPSGFRHPDGASAFRPKHGDLFSSAALLAAEDRLLALAAETSAPTVALPLVERSIARRPDGMVLSSDQAQAVRAIALSGRKVDVLVGPAGAGKTSTLAALRAAWEQEHGRDSVIGLAPTARAAEVLGGELGIRADNTVWWATMHRYGQWDFQPGQLVIVDEASTAGTFALDTLTQHAAEVGAKVLLVGDPAQLDAVDSSGAFSLVIGAIEDRPELTEVWRFQHEWEKQASLALRLGDPAAIDAYTEHDRITDGDADAMLDAVYQGWRKDVDAGWVSMMIAETGEAVTALNQRARLDRIADGTVDADHAVRLREGTEAGRGDLVMTRQNDRRLRTRTGWVKNGDVWRVVRAHEDGSLTVRRVRGRSGAVRLPATYTAAHVDLAYAVTAYRAQGATVDTAHALVASTSMSSESLYVALTRGRWSNRAYVASDQADLEPHQHTPERPLAATILAGILGHRSAELSAHETIRVEQDRWTSISQLAAEYDTIAQTAQRDRWLTLLSHSGLTPEQVDRVAEEESFGPLAAELRRAEANHHDPERLLRAAVAEREIRDGDDIGGVLRWRIQHASTPRTGTTRPSKPPRLIAGLIPAVAGVTDADLRRGLDERAKLIEQRARELADTAIAEQAAWIGELGPQPTGRAADVWRRHVAVVAAYRDRWNIETTAALGPTASSTNQRIDAARARAAIRLAQALTPVAGQESEIGRPAPGIHL